MQTPNLQPTATELRNRLHISYSQISTYMICPHKFFYAYVAGVQPEFVASALPFGGAFHATLAAFYRNLQAVGTSAGRRDLQEHFAANWELEKTVARQEIRYGASESWDALLDLGTRMMGAYHDQLAAKVDLRPEQVIAVELPLAASLETIDLVGTIDLILRDADDPTLFCIVDHKTAAKRYDERKLATDLQLTVYDFLVEDNRYLPDNSRVQLRWDVVLKTKQPAVESYRTVRNQADRRRMLDTVEAILRGIDAEVFFPNPGWACSGCGFQGICGT